MPELPEVETVCRAMRRYLVEANANTGGFFPTSRDSDAVLREASPPWLARVPAHAPVSELLDGPASACRFDVYRATLSSWAGEEGGEARAPARVLLVDDGEVSAGLLVEQSLGLQHFAADNFESTQPDGFPQLQQFLRGAYLHGGRVYYQVELASLLRDERFLAVAAR